MTLTDCEVRTPDGAPARTTWQRFLVGLATLKIKSNVGGRGPAGGRCHI